PVNAFAIDQRNHYGACGHALMQRIAHKGAQRLVWRSAWTHDVASGFPFISPVNDVGWGANDARYAKAASDPMNQWLCRTVSERGVRQARGLGRGISQLDEFVIVSPGAPEQSVTLADGMACHLEPVVAGAQVSAHGSGAAI